MNALQDHPIVSTEAWLAARRELLEMEKALSRQRDEVNAARLRLPWTRVEKDYRFTGPNGETTLADLFAERSQLIVQHFMFGPGWTEGCVGCSFLADHLDGARPHLENHDVSVVAISRAPWPEIAPFQKRMEWTFPWLSSAGSNFNLDFQASFPLENRRDGQVFYNFEWVDFECEELPGHSAFYRDPATGEIFHTYSAYSRGGEDLITTYAYLDIAPKGRNETGPNFNLGDWVKHHDRYAQPASGGCACHS